MANITTSTGFACEVNEASLDDMELLELIEALEERESVSAYRKIVDKILPGDRQRLYEHVRTEDGRVPISAVSAEVAEIFQLIKSGKK